MDGGQIPIPQAHSYLGSITLQHVTSVHIGFLLRNRSLGISSVIRMRVRWINPCLDTDCHISDLRQEVCNTSGRAEYGTDPNSRAEPCRGVRLKKWIFIAIKSLGNLVTMT